MYTKGEWKVDYKGTIGHIKAVIGDISPTVCRYSPPPNCALYIPEEEQRANAKLIASAPDLYEACKVQHDAIDMLFAMLIERDKKFYPSKSGRPWKAILKGNEAIAKAGG